jgi:septum formation protein
MLAMRKIILASGSKARQALLKQIGLRFRVDESKVQEQKKFEGRVADLVKQNALLKARAVAAKHDSGVVIAADTVVRVGRKIIGKPRNLRDAQRTLRLLSQKPQWVYSGIAVIDIDNQKTLTAFDKTKVFMCPLTERQINNYFKKVSPLDKAGSFDIQGLGSVFIDRVEGCFYNVVGLPLAKLANLLQRIGIEIF